MYITEPCVAFGLMAKSRKEASREKKIYKICIKLTLTPPLPLPKKKNERKKGKEGGKEKKLFQESNPAHLVRWEIGYRYAPYG